jgi:hypothetical protein
VRTLGLPQDEKATLKLMGIAFTITDDPAGEISLLFDGGVVMRLDVECLEAQMADLADVETP